jgi:glycerol-3-phosphate acyltransferase PlsY
MPPVVAALAVAVLGYVLGCFSTGYYLVRWRTGQDLRTIGSGATGGRNVGRVLGPAGFLVTGAGDLAKSALAVLVPMLLALGPLAIAGAMVGVTAGHVWPLQLGSRGGKGIAPFVGTTGVVAPLALAGGALVGVAVALLARRPNTGGLAGLAATPILALAMGAPVEIVVGCVASLALVVVAHLPNLRAELAGPPTLRLSLPPLPRAWRGDA